MRSSFGTQEEDTPSHEYLEEAFMLFYTAGSLGAHKQARAYLGLMMENGLVPSGQVIKELTAKGKKYEYLGPLTDLKTLVKPQDYSLIEFKQEMSGRSLVNYYLSSLADVSKKRVSRLDPDYGLNQEDSRQTKLSK